MVFLRYYAREHTRTEVNFKKINSPGYAPLTKLVTFERNLQEFELVTTRRWLCSCE